MSLDCFDNSYLGEKNSFPQVYAKLWWIILLSHSIKVWPVYIYMYTYLLKIQAAHAMPPISRYPF